MVMQIDPFTAERMQWWVNFELKQAGYTDVECKAALEKESDQQTTLRIRLTCDQFTSSIYMNVTTKAADFTVDNTFAEVMRKRIFTAIDEIKSIRSKLLQGKTPELENLLPMST